jgi:hypothetical protein
MTNAVATVTARFKATDSAGRYLQQSSQPTDQSITPAPSGDYSTMVGRLPAGTPGT